MSLPVKAGLETMLQLVPSQCSTRSPEIWLWVPTAQTSVEEMAVTAVNEPPPEGVGLVTTLQFVPFQCSINVWLVPLTVCPPTAQTSLLATADTPANELAASIGVGTVRQLVPLKCTANV